MRSGEEGAVLAMVLVALALLAALGGLVIRVSGSDLAGLEAQAALDRRAGMIASAMAQLGARLPARDLAEDGRELTLTVPGGQVQARVLAAAGLINPNATRQTVLAAALIRLGASESRAAALAQAMVRARGQEAGRGLGRAGFTSLPQVARLFGADPGLWDRVAPLVTLLGRAETPDPARAPAILRAVVAPASAAEVDFSGASLGQARGFYEIWLHVAAPARDAADPSGRLWTRVSGLVGRDRRLHVLAIGWPEPLPGLVMAEDG